VERVRYDRGDQKESAVMRICVGALLAFTLLLGTGCRKDPDLSFLKPRIKKLVQSDNQLKQRRTVADMRNIGTAMFSWLTDQIGAGAAGQNRITEVAKFPNIPRSKLEQLLVPAYIASLPEKDGWGNPYEIRLNLADKLSQNVMLIRSPGKNGFYSGESYSISSFPRGSYDEDLVWADGYFIRWPERDADNRGAR
jgi:hypothetical protein